MIILKIIAKIGEYKNDSMGIVMSPDAKPKKPLINLKKELLIL